VTFSWTPSAGAADYALRLGTALGGSNLYASGLITATSVTPGNLPTDGETVYGRLTTYFGSLQIYTDYVFTAATPAALTFPANGATLSGSKVTFTWSAASGATDYRFWLGTTAGSNNVYGSGVTTATSATASALPTNGETIHARLTTYYGGVQVYSDYTFTASKTP
jgi:hypothetical protein